MIDMSGCSVESFRKEVSVREFMETCVDVPRFLRCCQACPTYGKTWSCPPYDFSSEDIWKSYKSLLLIGKKVIVPQDLREKTFQKAEVAMVCNKLLAPFKHALLMELLALEAEHPGSMALSAGKCEICVVCTRLQNLPCRNPHLCRYSIEALGGDVVQAVEKYFGEKLIWEKEGHLPQHLFLIGGLLKP